MHLMSCEIRVLSSWLYYTGMTLTGNHPPGMVVLLQALSCPGVGLLILVFP